MLDQRKQRETRLEACRQFVHFELLSEGRGHNALGNSIQLTRGPGEDPEALALLQTGKLENPLKHRLPDQLLAVWVVSGQNTREPSETVENLLIGEYRTLPLFDRLGIRDGERWVHISKPFNQRPPSS